MYVILQVQGEFSVYKAAEFQTWPTYGTTM